MVRGAPSPSTGQWGRRGVTWEVTGAGAGAGAALGVAATIRTTVTTPIGPPPLFGGIYFAAQQQMSGKPVLNPQIQLGH